MKRDFVVIVGLQGYGKSLWSKIFVNDAERLFVFDPMASYANVDFSTPLLEQYQEIDLHNKKNFRSGSYDPDDIELMGHGTFLFGDCIFVCEEAHLVFNRHVPLGTWAKRIVFMGRHRRASIVLIAQRASSIPIDMRSQANRVICFAQHEEDDVKAMTSLFGKYDAKEKIPQLKPLECLDWHNGKITQYSIRDAVKRRLKITVDTADNQESN